ncbi:MAG: FHA domain-containing protein [Anaerolineales bacterium]
MDSFSAKFCPVCKSKNEPSAKVCAYCGSPLEFSHENQPSTLRVTRKDVETTILPLTIEEMLRKPPKPPEEGIAIYVKEYAEPIVMIQEGEFILGRSTGEEVKEGFVDLKPFGGYEDGVSRRHALIRRTGQSYEILDIGSSNGTWLNKKRLSPDKPFPLENGAEIYLGKMRIFVYYQEMSASS